MYLAKRSIIDFLKDKLQEKRGFKYSILVIVKFKKWKAEINAWEFQNIYIRSDAITVTNQWFYLANPFTKILNLLHPWEGECSGWAIDRVQGIYIHIHDYDPLAGSSYIPLPKELNHSTKGLINIKNNDIYCLRWCHVRMLNPQERNSQRITKQDKEIAKTLDY